MKLESGMYCDATGENYYKLRELGFTFPRRYENMSSSSNFLSTDIFIFDSVDKDIRWARANATKTGVINFDELQKTKTNIHTALDIGFIEPVGFNVQIFSVFKTNTGDEYIGAVNGNIPAKWDSEGVCLNPGKGYSLFREYKQRIYTKDNILGYNPKQKFKISWSEKMSLGLETSGWRLATNEEIDSLKF